MNGEICMLFDKKAVILFQGDSITDALRGYEPEGLGNGYARMCIRTLEALYPDYELTCFNRGISGNRIPDLADRWQEDCLDLKPDLVSILIGVNDTWHSHGVGLFGGVSNEDFELLYRKILEQTKATGAKIVLIEPFAFHHQALSEDWRDGDFGTKIMIVRKLAREYADAFIPMEGIFYENTVKYAPEELSEDGVHPTTLGHRIMAEAWLKAVGAL